MNLLAAALLVFTSTVKNRFLRQVKRLRQPRYLLATAAAGFYLWGMFIRRTAFVNEPVPLDALPVFTLVLSAMALFSIGASWLLGGDEAALRFTEAEVQFFFPAPVTRRTLLHYKLGRILVLTVFSAGVTTFFMGARLSAHPLYLWLGSWVAFSSLNMHLTAASLARASLVDHGVSGLRRQLLTLLVLVLMIVAIGGGLYRSELFHRIPGELPTVSGWADKVMDTAPLSYLILPIRASLQLAFSRTGGEFLQRLPVALVVLAVHYLWVMSSDVAFEEASLEAAEKRAKLNESWRRGRGVSAARRTRPPFRLLPHGAPGVAIVWKNLIGFIRGVSIRLWLILVGGIVAAVLLESWGRNTADFAIVTALSLVVAGYLVLLGPQTVRIDFRQDLERMDVLRSYPLSGRQMVTAEVVTPLIVLTLGQWATLLVATLCSLGIPSTAISLSERLAVGLAAALVVPGMTMGNLLIQNASALIFPTWVSTDPNAARGLEAMGQRLLTLAGSLLVLVVGLIPAAMVATLVSLPLSFAVGLHALPFGALAAAAMLFGEAWLALGVLGKAFERFDLSRG